jgi:hypothetical protein
LGSGALLLLGAGLVAFHPALHRYLLGGFFPPDLAWPAREGHARTIVVDAALGATLALLAGVLALLVAGGRLAAPRGALLTLGLVMADLWRTGAGLNPMVTPAFFEPSDAARATAQEVKAGGGRVFVLDPGLSPRYFAARSSRTTGHEVWSFAVLQETFTPDFNLPLSVPTAYSLDRTMLVPAARVLSPGEATASALPGLVDRLQNAAVSHVLGIDPLDHPSLELSRVARPDRTSPLAIYLYRLAGSKAVREVLGKGRVVSVSEDTDRVEIVAEAESDVTLVMREAMAPGWRASLDGRPVALLPYEDRYRSVSLPRGRHVVRLAYHPPGLDLGLGAAALGVLAVAFLAWPWKWRGST